MKVMVIDLSRCNGCYNCQIACKDEHVANDWSPYAKPQPDTGQFWFRLKETTRGILPRVRVTYEPRLCQHCDSAACSDACPVEGAIYKNEHGAVVIDPAKCTGCELCVKACPYGSIFYNRDLLLAQKCTWCSHLLADGWKEPRCVDACPTGALRFGEESELNDLLGDAEILRPELGTQPRVYYVGLPKPWVAGVVYDSRSDEVVVGATVTLTGDMGRTYESTTDDFGTFWIRNVTPGSYAGAIHAPGFDSKPLSLAVASEEVDLGDIDLA